jgi:cation transport ATPase
MSDEASLSIPFPAADEHGCGMRHAGDAFNWLDPELLSVIATLLFMLLGGFGAALGLPAAWAPWFFLAAYLTGGWHGTLHGVRSLLRGTVDVDLLMILAALGAAYVHHAFEGAMLLFLFSLSHALQEMAMERSRSAISALVKLRPETALCKRGAETVLAFRWTAWSARVRAASTRRRSRASRCRWTRRRATRSSPGRSTSKAAWK